MDKLRTDQLPLRWQVLIFLTAVFSATCVCYSFFYTQDLFVYLKFGKDAYESGLRIKTLNDFTLTNGQKDPGFLWGVLFVSFSFLSVLPLIIAFKVAGSCSRQITSEIDDANVPLLTYYVAAMNENEERIEGVIQAGSEEEIVSFLKDRGMFPIKIRIASERERACGQNIRTGVNRADESAKSHPQNL